jgi:hypothetical protein
VIISQARIKEWIRAGAPPSWLLVVTFNALSCEALQLAQITTCLPRTLMSHDAYEGGGRMIQLGIRLKNSMNALAN